MKNALRTGILLFFVFCFCQNSKSQNVILLKDRMETEDPNANLYYFTSELLQTRITSNNIFTIEAHRKATSSDSTIIYIAKYDLQGNLIKRKKLPYGLCNYANYYFGAYSPITNMHSYWDANNNLPYPNIKIYDNENNTFTGYFPYYMDSVQVTNKYTFYTFNSNLDSVALKTGNLTSPLEYNCYRDSEKNFWILSDTILRNGSGGAQLKLEKYDKDLNLIWSKKYLNDTAFLHGIYYTGSAYSYYFRKNYSLNMIDSFIYIGVSMYDSLQFLDTAQNESFMLGVLKISKNGNLIQLDSFRFKDNIYFEYNSANYSSVSFGDLKITNNRMTISVIRTTEPFEILELNRANKLAERIHSTSNTYTNMSIAYPLYNKGYINLAYEPFSFLRYKPVFYNLNSSHTGSIANLQSVNPLPDSFSVYYKDRFQKKMGYGTTWIDENFDTTYLMLGLINLKDSGIFMCILPLSEKYGVYTGNVYKDRNANCSFDVSTDSPFKGRTIEVTKTNVPIPYKYYDYTDNNGKFEMYVDSGSFTSKVLESNNLWQACPTTQTFSINGTTDTVNQNFYLKRLIACPNLSVSIDNSRLRPCMSNTYVVNHCNTGTADAIGATVVVDFDSLLTVDAASVPYTNIGNKYTFQVGTIKEDSCGLFTVNTTLNCSAVLGTTQCVEAHIYPDSVCTPIDPRWDRANVSVDGRCLGDSVLFRIRNIGSGNMSQIKKYIVIEDNVLRIMPINFQLNAGQEILLKRPANGTTQRLYAEQTDYFPYPSNPTAVVENCGGLNPGFVTQFPNNDGADFIAINCTQNRNSFDPNDKEGTPTGFDNQHFIAKKTDINYKIRFQNTGTDTAYDIYILDTISNKLDVSKLQMGATSHPYSYEIYGEGNAVLKVIFRNINLVDSFHNEPLSHGFFTYSIAQDTLNKANDKIYNHADIYFDANHPVKTNTTLHTVTDSYFRIISSVIENKIKATTNAYPNPFNDKCTIEIKSDNKQNTTYQFKLYNLNGALIQTQTVTNKVELFAADLPAAIYLYRIEHDGELVAAGKIVKE